MTPTQLKVLRQAVLDGGAVELDGIDKHPGWGQRERTAAAWLHAEGLGLYESVGVSGCVCRFTIWPRGRRALERAGR